jgi:hypothetical protein
MPPAGGLHRRGSIGARPAPSLRTRRRVTTSTHSRSAQSNDYFRYEGARPVAMSLLASAGAVHSRGVAMHLAFPPSPARSASERVSVSDSHSWSWRDGPAQPERDRRVETATCRRPNPTDVSHVCGTLAHEQLSLLRPCSLRVRGSPCCPIFFHPGAYRFLLRRRHPPRSSRTPFGPG